MVAVPKSKTQYAKVIIRTQLFCLRNIPPMHSVQIESEIRIESKLVCKVQVFTTISSRLLLPLRLQPPTIPEFPMEI